MKIDVSDWTLASVLAYLEDHGGYITRENDTVHVHYNK